MSFPLVSRDPMLQSPQGNETTLRPRRTRQRSSFGEVAGVAAAECTAVCCCCPCTLMKLLILAVYKVPAGVCRKAWAMKKKRKFVGKKKKKQGGLFEKRPNGLGPIGLTREELEMEVKRVKEGAEEEDKINSIVNGNDVETSDNVDLLEEEMWSLFYGTGFFRSPSQRDQ